MQRELAQFVMSAAQQSFSGSHSKHLGLRAVQTRRLWQIGWRQNLMQLSGGMIAATPSQFYWGLCAAVLRGRQSKQPGYE